MKIHLIRNIGIILLVFTLGLSSIFYISVYAEGGGTSSEKEVTVNGYTYYFTSFIYAGKWDGTPYVNASISIRTRPAGTNVPAGWMYAQGKLYTHSGTLKVTAVAKTNSSSNYQLNGDWASLDPADANTLYYAGGTAGFWNGTSYTYYTSYNTPSYQP